MADLPHSKPAKRRGRPPNNSSEVDEATLKARRQRNREAQNIFRKRRQAAEAAQGKRLRRLEEVVEEMSSIFMSFVDEMLASEVVSQQPDLVASLRKSMKHVLDLAHEVVGPDEMETTSSPVPNIAVTPPSAPVFQSANPQFTHSEMPGLLSSSTSPPALSSTASHTSEETTECDLNLGSDAAHRFCHTSRSLALPAPPGVTENIPEPETPPNEIMVKYPNLPPQIYGNGWSVHNNPILGSGMTEYWGSRMPLNPDTFAFRLAKASLTTAYLVLTKNHYPPIPFSEEERMFGSALCHRGRDDLLIRLRWLLGPGSDYMYRVVDLPYGQHGDQIFTRTDLNPGFDELGWASITKSLLNKDGSARYLSILGVEKQLLALGGRFVDTETLELNIIDPTAKPNPAVEVLSTQPESWSFVDFYSPDQLRPEPQAMKLHLNTGLLVSNLAKNAVCLMRGPGYPREALGSAIQESVTKVG